MGIRWNILFILLMMVFNRIVVAREDACTRYEQYAHSVKHGSDSDSQKLMRLSRYIYDIKSYLVLLICSRGGNDTRV